MTKRLLAGAQLGRCILAAGMEGQATAGGVQTAERLPFVCSMGPGTVVGAGPFLAHMDTMKYRARTAVRVRPSCSPFLRRRWRCAERDSGRCPSNWIGYAVVMVRPTP